MPKSLKARAKDVRALVHSDMDHAMPIKERLEGFDDGETLEAIGFFDPTPNGLKQ